MNFWHEKSVRQASIITNHVTSVTDLLLREVYQSGRLMLRWRHALVAEVVRQRYLQPAPEASKAMHAELANLFFSECEQQQQQQEEQAATGDEGEQSQPPADESADQSADEGARDTPFQSAAVSDVTYSARHVEESWLHLLKAGECVIRAKLRR